MTRIRHQFDLYFEIISPLHVGTGEFRPSKALVTDDRREEQPMVAVVARDACGRPYLPSTTLKGLIRRVAETIASEDRAAVIERLLGVIKDPDEPGRMGSLIVRGAKMVKAGDNEGAPFAFAENERAKFRDPELKHGLFVLARTRIDSASGTAQDSALYFQEAVVPGSVFRLDALIETRGADEEVVDLFVEVLAVLSDAEGQSIGKGAADGMGRIRLLSGRSQLTCHSLGNGGEFELVSGAATLNERLAKSSATLAERREAASASANRITGATLSFRCDAPFIVIDSSRRRKGGSADNDGKDPQIKAQRANGRPLLTGSSVAGFLRSRARWLARREALRAGGIASADSGKTIVKSHDDKDKLDAVERLFGVTGFRGRLSIHVASIKADEELDVTSVKLDRLSGAPIDGALFTTRTFIGVDLQLRLSVDLPRIAGTPEERLFDLLVDDIKSNGLQLGHGTNKGFGWFEFAGDRP